VWCGEVDRVLFMALPSQVRNISRLGNVFRGMIFFGICLGIAPAYARE